MNKGNKNLAKGKYMLAESQKKDAADILIVIVICEILRLTNADVILITGDHFGCVLQEIIKNYFGHRFTSIKKDEIDFVKWYIYIIMDIKSFNKALASQVKKALEFSFTKEMDPTDE